MADHDEIRQAKIDSMHDLLEDVRRDALANFNKVLNVLPEGYNDGNKTDLEVATLVYTVLQFNQFLHDPRTADFVTEILNEKKGYLE